MINMSLTGETPMGIQVSLGALAAFITVLGLNDLYMGKYVI